MNVEETALSLIANAGFRDSRVIPARVVKGLLIEALSGVMQSELRIVQHLEDFMAAVTVPIILRRAIDAGLRKRIERLESDVLRECPVDALLPDENLSSMIWGAK